MTPYMEFHPGGEEELMRGVGMDATDLFNEVSFRCNSRVSTDHPIELFIKLQKSKGFNVKFHGVGKLQTCSVWQITYRLPGHKH